LILTQQTTKYITNAQKTTILKHNLHEISGAAHVGLSKSAVAPTTLEWAASVVNSAVFEGES
jgi:hypothetical protein